MPVSQINKTITPYSGDPPAIGQDQQTFSANAFRKAMHDPVVVEDINQVIGQINAVAGEMNAAITEAVTKANEADQSANDAEASKLHARDYANEAAQIKEDTQTLKEQANQARLDAEAALDAFDDKYLGSKTSDPTLDNDGEPLQEGAFYVNSTTGKIRVFTNGGWVQGIASVAGVESINAIQGAINLKSLNGVSLLGEGDIQTATLDGEETLTNKTIVDPILALSGTNGLAGQVPVSQGAGLPPVWGNADALPSQSGNSGKFLTTDGYAASWAAVDVPYGTKRIPLNAALSPVNNSANSINSVGARHMQFGDLTLYEDSSGGFAIINSATDTLVQQASFGFSPFYFYKVSETRVLVARLYSASTPSAYLQMTLYSVSASGIDLVTPVASNSINVPDCYDDKESAYMVALTETKFIIGYTRWISNSQANITFSPVRFFAGVFSIGTIVSRYVGPNLQTRLPDIMRIDDNRALAISSYLGGGVSDQTRIDALESTDGIALTEGSSSPTYSYCRTYVINPFDPTSRPIYQVSALKFIIPTVDTNDANNRRISCMLFGVSGTAATTNTVIAYSSGNIGYSGVVKFVPGSATDTFLMLSSSSNTYPGLTYCSLSGASITIRYETSIGSSNDGASQQFLVKGADPTKAYLMGFISQSGNASFVSGVVTMSATTASYSQKFVINNLGALTTRGSMPRITASGTVVQLTTKGYVTTDMDYKFDFRYKELLAQTGYNSINLVGSKAHIIGRGYIDTMEIT